MPEERMRLIQFENPSLGRCLGVVEGEQVQNVTARDPALNSVYRAFLAPRRAGQRLEQFLQALLTSVPGPTPLAYPDLLAAGRVLAPVGEEAGARLLVSGTGLTHLGSVQQRDEMHRATQTAGPKSDSRKMLEMGLAGGRPAPEQRGTAPEWFYKGDGRVLRGPGRPLDVLPFAPDGGEEPEIAGVYVVDDRGLPCRLGFVQ